jgi:hypothetical protein
MAQRILRCTIRLIQKGWRNVGISFDGSVLEGDLLRIWHTDRCGRFPYIRRRWGLDASIDDITLRGALRVLKRINAWAAIFAGPGLTLVAIVWLASTPFPIRFNQWKCHNVQSRDRQGADLSSGLARCLCP